MERMRTDNRSHIITALLSAAAGGLTVIVLTNAIPRMMKRMMAGMMENMRLQMGAKGCKPEEM
jgi:zinc transporter ZupT